MSFLLLWMHQRRVPCLYPCFIGYDSVIKSQRSCEMVGINITWNNLSHFISRLSCYRMHQFSPCCINNIIYTEGYYNIFCLIYILRLTLFNCRPITFLQHDSIVFKDNRVDGWSNILTPPDDKCSSPITFCSLSNALSKMPPA